MLSLACESLSDNTVIGNVDSTYWIIHDSIGGNEDFIKALYNNLSIYQKHYKDKLSIKGLLAMSLQDLFRVKGTCSIVIFRVVCNTVHSINIGDLILSVKQDNGILSICRDVRYNTVLDKIIEYKDVYCSLIWNSLTSIDDIIGIDTNYYSVLKDYLPNSGDNSLKSFLPEENVYDNVTSIDIFTWAFNYYLKDIGKDEIVNGYNTDKMKMIVDTMLHTDIKCRKLKRLKQVVPTDFLTYKNKLENK